MATKEKKLPDVIQSVYVLNGTEHEDLSSPMSPFQGKTLAKYVKVNGEWSLVMRDSAGNPNLGYLAQEIDDKTAVQWKHRITQANASPELGYIDSAGHWFPGQAVGSVITLAAWNKLQVLNKNSYYQLAAEKVIDRMADKALSHNHPRGAEYEARYKEAKEFLKSGKEDSELYQYLSQLQYKGLSLKEAADLVISKYEKANSLDVVISNLRMKKALLKGNLPLSEKEELYNAIVAGLNSAKV